MTLKQCPFCGGKARVLYEMDTDFGRCWFVECAECYARGPSIVETDEKKIPPERLYYAIEKAVKVATDYWNRRVENVQAG